MEKTDAFYWLKSDRSTFQIFCSRSLRQYRINYKFHLSVRLLTIKISQLAYEDSVVIVKYSFSLCKSILGGLLRANYRVQTVCFVLQLLQVKASDRPSVFAENLNHR